MVDKQVVITERDRKLFDFLEYYEIASSSTIAKKFFPSENMARKRLKKLFENKRVKRFRLSQNHDYVYYIKKPKEYVGKLLLTEFIRYAMNNSVVLMFDRAKKFGNMIPDGYMIYAVNGQIYFGFIEIETSKKGFDYQKYEEYFKTYNPNTKIKCNGYECRIMPIVYVVCKYAKIPDDCKVKYIKIKTDFSDFRLYPVT